ncbi:MAG: PE-PPE domain-containing protein [Mycobacterium sp.]
MRTAAGPLKICAVLAVAAATALPASTFLPVQFAAKTLLMVPGNDNPDGAGVEAKLNSAFDPSHPNYDFTGYDMVKVAWLSDSFDGDPGYAVSQKDGVAKLDAAITTYGTVADEDDVDNLIVVGYSSGAVVVIREMKDLDTRAVTAPTSDQIEFLVFGSPHRPNGGIFTRFPGFQFAGIVFDGANPDTRYELTDIGYEYDPVSDFPAYPLMPLSLVNSVLAFQYLHVKYVGAESDPVNAIDDPNLTYHDEVKGIRYVTIPAPHLPLLMPAYDVLDLVPWLRPVGEPLLKLIEPTLKVLVDLGYNREVPVGADLPARLLPSLDPAKVLQDVTNSIAAGLAGAWTSIAGTDPPTESGSEPAVTASAADLEDPAADRRSAGRADIAGHRRADRRAAATEASAAQSEPAVSPTRRGAHDPESPKPGRQASGRGTEERKPKAGDHSRKEPKSGSGSVRNSDTRSKAEADAA